MKVAVLISGFVRNLDNHKVYKKFLENNHNHNIDLFMNTYDKLGTIGPYRGCNHSKKLINVSKNICDDDVIKLWNPTVFKLNKFDEVINEMTKDVENIDYSKNDQVIKTYSQFCMVYNCFNLLEEYIKLNNVKYDLVIKLRTDIYFDQMIIDNLPVNDSINLFVRGFIKFNKDKLIYTNDTCSFGNFEVMKEYCKLGEIDRFTYCSKIAKEICKDKNKIEVKGGACHITFIGELLMTINLNYFKIPIARHQINYGLIRTTPNRLKEL